MRIEFAPVPVSNKAKPNRTTVDRLLALSITSPRAHAAERNLRMLARPYRSSAGHEQLSNSRAIPLPTTRHVPPLTVSRSRRDAHKRSPPATTSSTPPAAANQLHCCHALRLEVGVSLLLGAVTGFPHGHVGPVGSVGHVRTYESMVECLTDV